MNEALLQRLTPVVRRLRRIRFMRLMTVALILIGIVGWLMRRAFDAAVKPPSSAAAWKDLRWV